MVDHDQQLQIAQGTQSQLLIRPGNGRVAAADDQRADLALTRLEDLLRERRGGHLAAITAQVADARRRPRCRRAWGDDLCPPRRLGK